ncbi:aldo/keto reductase [Lentisphaera profundi]|uniref:Aldo/keto reductase n=1 Tax=Lentisphaera profundi TaxID=1658616 RepID=A0ABY7VRU8_9BACT|nr:aldo/keto reductase [Lentisphaera profundi]WDE96933.1 aldo/keto reductase [Lentisphaera profundi]
MSKSLPKVIFGTSSLGNLFSEPLFETKLNIVKEIVAANPDLAVFDSAGKYGAGLALESLAECLSQLNVPQDKVLISNKLAWKRVPLTSDEPTFEPGAWINLKNDAVQDISYQGIIDCYEQGNELLGNYDAQLVSIHDPDEYLSSAKDEAELKERKTNLLDAFKALAELKEAGKVQSIGVGAKDISVIDFISDHIQLDWAMFACSITPYTHSDFAKGLLKKLGNQGVDVINSAVFNAGFLIGGTHFDYQVITEESHPEIFAWRTKFFAICEEFDVKPAAACVQFSFLFPEIKSIALNTSKPERVKSNMDLVYAKIPSAFWDKMKAEKLINL